MKDFKILSLKIFKDAEKEDTFFLRSKLIVNNVSCQSVLTFKPDNLTKSFKKRILNRIQSLDPGRHITLKPKDLDPGFREYWRLMVLQDFEKNKKKKKTVPIAPDKTLEVEMPKVKTSDPELLIT